MSRKASGECALFKTQVYERCPASFLRDHFGGQGKVRLLTLGRSSTRVGRQKLDGDGEKRLKPKRWAHGSMAGDVFALRDREPSGRFG